MSNVSSGTRHPNRFLLATALVAFGLAGVVTTASPSFEAQIGATVVAIIGVVCLARYIGVISRMEHARTSLALWLVVLGASVVYGIGLEPVGTIVPADSTVVQTAFYGIIWAAFLGGSVSTTILAFREIGRRTGTQRSEERVLESEYDL